jgi:hypothetical protein
MVPRTWLQTVLVLTLATPVAAQTVTAPAAVDNVNPAQEWSTRAFQDPWDMTERTDVPWSHYGVEADTGLTNVTFASSIFSATTTNSSPWVYLLDTDMPATSHIGRFGTNYPIDATTYKVLAWRMSVTKSSTSGLCWWISDIFSSSSNYASSGPVTPGWRIYVQRIPDLARSGPDPWAGTIRTFQMRPTRASAPDTLQIDWVRLVNDDPTLYRTITWTGGGNYDVYLDSDSTRGNGNLGAIAKNTSGGSLLFYIGALPAGDYWVAMTTTGGDPTVSSSYSSGYYHVDGIPTLSFTTPSEEGSSDDFATTVLANPWDMDALSDVDSYEQITSPQITNISAEDMAGNNLGSVRVLKGTSVASPIPPGDPILRILSPAVRGVDKRIDPDLYRVLTFELGLAGARDWRPTGGSIGRIIWWVDGETYESVSQDILLNHKTGTQVLEKIILDMKTLEMEPSSPSPAGWVPGGGAMPGIKGLRLEPHEFSSAKDFFVRRVKLAAFEQIAESYQIQWNYGASGSATSLALYYDQTGSGFAGTLIAAGLNPTAGSYTWNTSGLPAGSYYIYGKLSRAGTLLNQNYARWPVVRAATYALNLTKTGAGSGTVTSSPAGISCGSTCSALFAPGATVTLTASASAGSNFAGWSSEGCSGIGSCQVTMSQVRNVTATFIPLAASGFVPLAPCRLLDTRVNSGDTAAAPVLAGSSLRAFSLLGKCGLPAGAKAISANLTVVAAVAEGDLRVVGGHLESTLTSSLMIPLSRARANNAIVQLSIDGIQTISVINGTSGSVHFIMDINGYFQ